MFSKIFILFTSFIHHEPAHTEVRPVVTVPEDEIVINYIPAVE
jgi:hypothetical protein